MNSKTKQSIYDMTVENFGQLDNIVQFVRDNNFNFIDQVVTDTELIINNSTGIGNERNKDAIILQQLTFNNNFEELITSGIGAMIVENTFTVT